MNPWNSCALAKGGEIAQGVLRQLFPVGFWLHPDPSGHYLWAFTQTALSPDWQSKLDANGYLPAEHWPRVYSAATDVAAAVAASQVRENSMVAGAGFDAYLEVRLG